MESLRKQWAKVSDTAVGVACFRDWDEADDRIAWRLERREQDGGAKSGWRAFWVSEREDHIIRLPVYLRSTDRVKINYISLDLLDYLSLPFFSLCQWRSNSRQYSKGLKHLFDYLKVSDLGSWKRNLSICLCVQHDGPDYVKNANLFHFFLPPRKRIFPSQITNEHESL